MGPYAKFIVALAGAFVTILVQILSRKYGIDLSGMTPELINAVGGLLTALLVYQVPNTTPGGEE